MRLSICCVLLACWVPAFAQKTKLPTDNKTPTGDSRKNVKVDTAFEEGLRHYEGNGVPVSYDTAFKHFAESAKAGNVTARALIAFRMVRRGQGVALDPDEAEKQLKKIKDTLAVAADRGDPIAQALYGRMLWEGLGVAPNPVKGLKLSQAGAQSNNKFARLQSFELELKAATFETTGDATNAEVREIVLDKLKKLANEHYAMAQCVLGDTLYRAAQSDAEYKAAVKWLKLAADQNEPFAQVILAECYEIGEGVAKDDKLAVELYRKAAAQNHPDAWNSLGSRYFEGTGVEKSHKLSAEAFQHATDLNNPWGMSQLGTMYQSGLGVPQDLHKAYKLFKSSAELGDHYGMLELGHCYLEAAGVEKNPKLAAEWIIKSAEGIPSAKYYAAKLYESGSGVKQSLTKAAKLYREAAQQDIAVAQYNLGRLYENGLGVKQNKAKAIEWYRKAAAQNDEEALAALKRLDED